MAKVLWWVNLENAKTGCKMPQLQKSKVCPVHCATHSDALPNVAPELRRTDQDSIAPGSGSEETKEFNMGSFVEQVGVFDDYDEVTMRGSSASIPIPAGMKRLSELCPGGRLEEDEFAELEKPIPLSRAHSHAPYPYVPLSRTFTHQPLPEYDE